MACNTYTLNGMDVVCKEQSTGGVKEIYVALSDDVTAVALDDDDVTKATMITSITMVTGKKFKLYKLLKSTSGLTSTLNTSETTPSYFTNELSLQFMKMEAAKRLEIMALMMSACVVIVRDTNDKYWYLGKNNYVECSAGSATTGTAMTDSNHYELTLSDTSSELPYEVDPTIIPGLLPA